MEHAHYQALFPALRWMFFFVSNDKSKALLHLCALAIALIALSGCGINPVTGEREMQIIPENQEIDLGIKSYLPAQQSQGGEYILDPSLSRYVSDIGGKLALNSDRSQLPYEFVILNNSVPNAWAMPGGKIAVNRGLLTGLDNEAELAAVLAHEIVHAAARHGAKSMERGMLLQAGVGAVGIGLAVSGNKYGDLLVGSAMIGANLINQRYGRDHESESDYYGMQYMSRSGYNPEAAVTLQEKFVKMSAQHKSNWLEGLFSSHPPSQERVDANRQTLATLPSGGEYGVEKYKSMTAKIKKAQPAYDLYDEGLEALSKGNSSLALEKATKALAGEPNEALFNSLRGDVYAKERKFPEALAEYDLAINKNDRYYRFFQQRGTVRQELGQTAAAKADFERANSLMPTATTSNALGLIALKENRQQEAAGYFRQAANGDSEVGRQAGRNLAMLELRHNPGKYIAVAFQPSGEELYMIVENQSPVTVKNLAIAVQVVRGNRQSLANGVVRVPMALSPGERQVVPTRIRVRPADLPTLSVTHSIETAEPVL